MAVSEGFRAKVTVQTTSGSTQTVAELREWRLTGASRNVITFSAFGDETMRKKKGPMNPGSLTFSGYFDGTDTTGQLELIKSLSSGAHIGPNCSDVDMSTAIKNMKLWLNDDTNYSNYGWFSCTGSTSASVFINGLDISVNTDGLGEITFSGEVTGGTMDWTT